MAPEAVEFALVGGIGLACGLFLVALVRLQLRDGERFRSVRAGD